MGLVSRVPAGGAAVDPAARDRAAVAARLGRAQAPISTLSRAARGGCLPGDPDYLDGGLGRFGLGCPGRLDDAAGGRRTPRGCPESCQASIDGALVSPAGRRAAGALCESAGAFLGAGAAARAVGNEDHHRNRKNSWRLNRTGRRLANATRIDAV